MAQASLLSTAGGPVPLTWSVVCSTLERPWRGGLAPRKYFRGGGSGLQFVGFRTRISQDLRNRTGRWSAWLTGGWLGVFTSKMGDLWALQGLPPGDAAA